MPIQKSSPGLGSYGAWFVGVFPYVYRGVDPILRLTKKDILLKATALSGGASVFVMNFSCNANPMKPVVLDVCVQQYVLWGAQNELLLKRT